MLFTEDSIISAPYFAYIQLFRVQNRIKAWGRTFTTLELALLCSYARSAVLTMGSPDTRETKSCDDASWSSGSNVRDATDAIEGDVREDEVDREGVSCDAMRRIFSRNRD